MPSTERRQKGEGSITKLPNGKLKMTITVGRGIDGKQKRRSVSAYTKTELLQKASALRLDKTPATAREMTLAQLYSEFERESLRDKESGTKKLYTTLWGRLKETYGGMKLSKFTPSLISDILLSFTCLSSRNKGELLKSSSLITNKRMLSAIFNFAVAREYITKNPCVGTLKGIRGTKKADLEVITKEQLKVLLDDAKDNDAYTHSNAAVGIHWYPIMLLAASTGMRRGELLGLRKSAIDIENGRIDVRAQVKDGTPDLPLKTKNSYRRIHIDPEVLAVVLADSDPESDFVFANRKTHRNITMAALTTSFTVFIRKYNHKPFDGFSLHDLRHYHATQLIMAGTDIKTVSRRLGHADIRTTLEHYMHWVLEADEKASTIVGADLLY